MKTRRLFFAGLMVLFCAAAVAAQDEEFEELSPAPDTHYDPALATAKITSPDGQNKISLDIKGMDVIDVLKMLAGRANMNIVVGKNVTGRVTLFLKDVDVWDAFEIILLANDLAYEKKGSIINVMTQRDYELIYGERFQDKKLAKVVQLKYAKAIDLSRALNQIKTNLGRIVVDEGSNTIALIDSPLKVEEMEAFIRKTDTLIQTKVFELNYAQVDKLAPKIQEMLTKGIGSLRIDERTNKLVVTDYPPKLNEIGQVITAFDEKTPQVLIDAQIIEITPTDTFKMGVNWQYWIESNFRYVGNFAAASGNQILQFGVAAKDAVIGQKGDYSTVVDLLHTIGATKTLASPRIVTLNNQEAKILVGSKEPYGVATVTQSTTTAATATTIEYIESGIKLSVTPTINRDGYVTMKIKPEISSAESRELEIAGQKNTAFSTTSSEAETTVMLKDGVTILIGGLKKDVRTESISKLPILGDIPFIKWAFRSKSKEITGTKELVILITPHIITGDSPLTNFAEALPKNGAVASMVKDNVIIEKIKAVTDEQGPFDELARYYEVVSQRLKNLIPSGLPKDQKGQVKLAFTLSKDGYLVSGPKILETSNSKLKTAAIKTVKSASPFPSFPRSLAKEEETFTVKLVYE